jgi:hypothetical protein
MKYLSARQIWRDAFAVLPSKGGGFFDPGTTGPEREGQLHAHETRSSRGNGMQVVNMVEMGKAQTLIAGLPILHRSWGNFAYTDIFTTLEHNRIRQWLFSTWAEKNAEDYQGDFTKSYRTLILVDLATEDMKSRLTTGKAKGKLHDHLGINRQNVKRDGWAARLEAMEDLIDQVDREALRPLMKLLPEHSISA